MKIRNVSEDQWPKSWMILSGTPASARAVAPPDHIELPPTLGPSVCWRQETNQEYLGTKLEEVSESLG